MIGCASMPFWLIMINGIFFIAIADVLRWAVDRYLKNKYRWKCPKCDFRMKTNNKETWNAIRPTIASHIVGHRKS